MIHPVIETVVRRMGECGLHFASPPLVIGGMAMEYYGLRKSGADIDLVISAGDYDRLAAAYPDARKDIYGDMGVVIAEFEIWRSIALLDYAFLKEDAVDCGDVLMVSPDRLLLMRGCAMEVEKYRRDLELVKNWYYEHHRNPAFLAEAETHIPDYEKYHGVILGGAYEASRHDNTGTGKETKPAE